ncbi:dnaJ homolog subfamily C member 12-like [Apostichopus japonicus]|uniref:dnaJ homolog subfamily C member 12-like n=1 Tax=Stichopus japonicus TaxID=307972 RepID=UPI003AB38C57
MDEIWNATITDEDDFYKVLGCDESSTMEQIMTEYKALARECHPDKRPNDPEAAERFSKIQKAREVLGNEESRADYDKWRRSGLTIRYSTWLATHGHARMSLHWATKKKPQPALEDCSPPKHDISFITQESYTPSLSKMGGAPFFEDFGWRRDTGNDMLRKFRNYQI